MIGRCNGINENQAYRPPSKLPAIVYYKQDGSGKTVIEYPETRRHMVRDSTIEEFAMAMKSFLRH